MPKVFVSYRRADGPYGVGWLAERLRRLDLADPETVFVDAAMRAGDDFPAVLEDAVRESSIVLAVIGPHWRGDRGERSPARIMEQDDWVVRELRLADEHGKHVMPVTLAGAELPLASEVHSSISYLVTRNAKPFENRADLDVIQDDVEDYLEREREAEAAAALVEATRAGLQDPIIVEQLANRRTLVVASVVMAIAMGALGFTLARYSVCPDTGPCSFDDSFASGMFTAMWTLLGAVAGGAFPAGVALLGRLRMHGTFDRRGAILAVVVTLVLFLLAVFSFGGGETAPGTPVEDELRIVAVFVVGAVLIFPWPLLLVAPGISRTRAADHELRQRLVYLGNLRDAERWAAIILSVTFSLAVASIASLGRAIDHAAGTELYQPMQIIAFSVVGTGGLLGCHLWAMTALQVTYNEIDERLKTLDEDYQKNAAPVLQAPAFDTGGVGFRLFLAAPAITAGIIIIPLLFA